MFQSSVTSMSAEIGQPLQRQGDVGHRLVGRQDAHLDRQHQRHEDQPERHHAEAEAEIGDGEGREQRHRDLADRDADRDDEGIDEQPAEIALRPGRRGVGEELGRPGSHGGGTVSTSLAVCEPTTKAK